MKNYAEKQLVAKLREQYLANPPEGMSRQDIKHMSDSDLLDMDYFLHEFDDDDEVGAEGFYIFQTTSSISRARLQRTLFNMGSAPQEQFPIKRKKPISFETDFWILCFILTNLH